MKNTTRGIRPTEEQAEQLAALDAIRDQDIDLSDVPEQGARTDWVSGLNVPSGDARDFNSPPRPGPRTGALTG